MVRIYRVRIKHVICAIVLLIIVFENFKVKINDTLKNQKKQMVPKMVTLLPSIRQTQTVVETSIVKAASETANIDFDIEKDLMVFLHIQKTSGTTFSMNLIDNLQVYDRISNTWEKACYIKPHLRRIKNTKERQLDAFFCPRKNPKFPVNWFFTWHTVDYKLCGNHADLTRLRNCIPQLNNRARNYVFISILRDPIKRYISEWRNLQHGTSWS
jgi:hypothetical protein